MKYVKELRSLLLSQVFAMWRTPPLISPQTTRERLELVLDVHFNQPLWSEIRIDKNYLLVSPIPWLPKGMWTETSFIDQPGRAKVFPLLMSRMKEQGAGSSLCYTQSLCHWWKSPPTGICMTASWNQICFPHIQPSSACKQLDFSLLLHLNFKNLETVNIELSAPELILFLAPTIKLPVCKAKT